MINDRKQIFLPVGRFSEEMMKKIFKKIMKSLCVLMPVAVMFSAYSCGLSSGETGSSDEGEKATLRGMTIIV